MKKNKILLIYIFFSFSMLAGKIFCDENKTEDEKEKAKIFFQKGVEFFKTGNYKEALENFNAAYQAKPHARIKFNIGICHYYLGDFPEAGNALRLFLSKESKNSPQEVVREAEEKLKDVENKTGYIEFQISRTDAVITINDKSYEGLTSGEGLYLGTGKHNIVAKTPDGAKWEGNVELKAGEKKIISVNFVQVQLEKEVSEKTKIEAEQEKIEEKKIKPPDRSYSIENKKAKTSFYAFLALTAISAIGGTVAGAIAMQKSKEVDDLDSDCQKNNCQSIESAYNDYKEKRDDAYNKGKMAGNASTGLWITTGAFGISSIVYLIFWKPWKKEAKLSDSLKINPSIGSVSLSLNF